MQIRKSTLQHLQGWQIAVVIVVVRHNHDIQRELVDIHLVEWRRAEPVCVCVCVCVCWGI